MSGFCFGRIPDSSQKRANSVGYFYYCLLPLIQVSSLRGDVYEQNIG